MSFLLWSITRTHTPTVLISVLTAKNRTFKIVRNAIWSAGIISSEKYSAVWRISAIRSKKNRTAKVFNSELKTIQPFGIAEVFRTANSAFRNVLDLPNCHTLITEHPSRCWRIFQRYCSTDAKRCHSIQAIFFPVYYYYYYYYSPPHPWLRPSRNVCCVTIYSNGCNVD